MKALGKYGRLTEPTLEEAIVKLRENAARHVFVSPEALLRAGPRGEIPNVITHGWKVLLSAQRDGGPGLMWNGSAALSPPGRSSTEADWAALGRIIALSGAPKEAMSQVESQIATGLAANRPHHWAWRSER